MAEMNDIGTRPRLDGVQQTFNADKQISVQGQSLKMLQSRANKGGKNTNSQTHQGGKHTKIADCLDGSNGGAQIADCLDLPADGLIVKRPPPYPSDSKNIDVGKYRYCQFEVYKNNYVTQQPISTKMNMNYQDCIQV